MGNNRHAYPKAWEAEEAATARTLRLGDTSPSEWMRMSERKWQNFIADQTE